MSDEHDKPSYIRHLRLASGRHIHVLFYERDEESGDQDLGLCGTCACPLMQPLCAEPMGKSHWRVTLRCPNCLWVGTGVVTGRALERFDEARGHDIDLIRHDLERISLANMVEETERFVRALNGDHILPSDF